MKRAILYISFILFYVWNVYSQCSVTAYANPTTICAGDEVNLSAVGSCGYLMNNDFNNGTPGTGWVATTGVQFDNPCNPSYDGTTYLWMGPNVPIPRTLTSVGFNISSGCQVKFAMKYAIQSQSSPCEGPDEYDEGVTLQYTTNGGSTWVDIAYFRPDGTILPNQIPPGSNNTQISGNTPFTVWNVFTFNLPAGAISSNTQIRWRQEDWSGSIYDHWGLDKIELTCPSNVQVTWSNGATGYNPPPVYPTSDTTYYVTVTDIVNNVSATDSVHITVKPVPTADFTVSPSICLDSFATFIYTGTGSSNAFYNWLFSGGTIISGNPTGPGPIKVRWSSTGMMYVSLQVSEDGCTSETKYDSVMVYPVPVPNFSATPTEGCEDLLVQFSNSTNTYNQTTTYTWSFGDGNTSTDANPTHTYTNPGIYDVTLYAKSNEGCDSIITKPQYIHVYYQPVVDIWASPMETTITSPEITFGSNASGIDTWFWDFGDGNTSDMPPTLIHNYTSDGSFTVTVIGSTSYGCSDTASVTVKILAEPQFYNIITPNGDGKNDFFVILNGEKIPNHLWVYNRWGKLVFEAENYKNDWDGKNLSDGTYYYIYKYGIDLKNEYRGTLTIVRE